jgi:hypothetical protein
MSSITWRTTKQVAERIHRDPCTVRRLAETGQLHGHQSTRGGRWVFADAAVDAHVQGLDDRAQREACGCARLRAVRRTG